MMKKVALVAHEFGLFKGRGGIATYLYHLSKGILKYYEGEKIDLHVIAIACDIDTDLLKYSNFHLHPLSTQSLESQGLEVLSLLKQIKPVVVEVAEAFAFCLESILYKNYYGKELKNTKFFTINHTATRECFEWSYQLPLSMSPRIKQAIYLREKAQMYLTDCNIFPAEFLKNYVIKNYKIKTGKILRYTYCGNPESKEEIVKRLNVTIDSSTYDNIFVISYISRLEGRKNQSYLVESFIDFLKRTKANAVLFLAGNSLSDVITEQDERMKIYSTIPDEYKDMIHFFDFVDDKMIELLSAVTDLTVMTSVFENFPFAMIENIYRRIPIMTSKYNGCSDCMGKYKDIMTFDPFKEEDLSRKIENFYNMSSCEKEDIANAEYIYLQSLCNPQNSINEKMNYYLSYKEERELLNNYLILSQKNLLEEISITSTHTTVELVICQNRIKKNIKNALFAYNSMLRQMDDNGVLIIGYDFDYDINILEALYNQRIIVIKNFPLDISNNGRKFYEIIAEEIISRDLASTTLLNTFLYAPILFEEYEDLVDRKEKDNDGSYMPIIATIIQKTEHIKMEDRYVEK